MSIFRKKSIEYLLQQAGEAGSLKRTLTATSLIGLGIGAIMAALGVYIALRALMSGGTPLTGTLGLDLAFAVFFIARGGLQ